MAGFELSAECVWCRGGGPGQKKKNLLWHFWLRQRTTRLGYRVDMGRYDILTCHDVRITCLKCVILKSLGEIQTFYPSNTIHFI